MGDIKEANDVFGIAPHPAPYSDIRTLIRAAQFNDPDVEPALRTEEHMFQVCSWPWLCQLVLFSSSFFKQVRGTSLHTACTFAQIIKDVKELQDDGFASNADKLMTQHSLGIACMVR